MHQSVKYSGDCIRLYISRAMVLGLMAWCVNFVAEMEFQLEVGAS